MKNDIGKLQNYSRGAVTLNPKIIHAITNVRENLKLLRSGLGLDYAAIAKICGVEEWTIRCWECGRCDIPAAKLQILADHFHLKCTDFLSEGGIVIIRDPDNTGRVKAVSGIRRRD